MRDTQKKWRISARIVILVIAAVFALQILPVTWLAVILPALSPFLAVCSAIAVRSVCWLFLLCLPVLIISLFRNRWFCVNMCPTGLLTEFAGKLRPGSKSEFRKLPRLGPYVVLFALAGALFGYPVFLWLDPLSVFNVFVSVWHKPIVLLNVLPGVGLIFILVLSIWRPNAWCYRFCPLGFSQELLRKLIIYIKKSFAVSPFRRSPVSFFMGRRLFFAALGGGIVGVAARKVLGREVFIRPPGSVEEGKFTSVCARCGNCVRVCPENIIHHDLGRTGLSGFWTPIIGIGAGYCNEWCNECNKVCPTNAIAHLSMKNKQSVSIGAAKVEKSLCLAWKENQHCMVCHEYCPYHAIKDIKEDNVPCPEVDPDICRGCGLCQTVCPAKETAIIVRGKPQKRLKPVEL
ncbi:4Fe-4S binding protein [Verrucomicrobiota bacterium]